MRLILDFKRKRRKLNAGVVHGQIIDREYERRKIGGGKRIPEELHAPVSYTEVSVRHTRFQLFAPTSCQTTVRAMAVARW